MNVKKKLQSILLKYKNFTNRLLLPNLTSTEIISILKKQSFCNKVNVLMKKYFYCKKIVSDSDEIILDLSFDKELKNIAFLDKNEVMKDIVKIENELKILLIGKDVNDEKESIVEIRAGSGGEEAALFVSDLFRMYSKVCDNKGWKYDIVSFSKAGKDGLKEITISVNAKGCYKFLKFESGVHRVQRIPKTESSGRMHTSAATVAILPQVDNIDIDIKDHELRIDSYKGSGAGGQHVNTTDSAIRITHLPTGITVVQGEKSQHQNKIRAMKILRSRLYDLQEQSNLSKRASFRKGLIGTGDRSQRIRTYNFPQNRITDHRINLTLYNLESILVEGNIDTIINTLSKKFSIGESLYENN